MRDARRGAIREGGDPADVGEPLEAAAQRYLLEAEQAVGGTFEGAHEVRRLGIARREIADEEITERCVLALINEGARVLEAGIAAAGSDIDVIWCNGYGFPRARGGPMFCADTLGLDSVLARIERYAREQGERYWTAAPLLARLAAEGRRLAEWRMPAQREARP